MGTHTHWVPGPIQASGVVEGTTKCYPVITIQNNGAEIASGYLQVWQYTAGAGVASLIVSAAIPTGLYIKLDCALRKGYYSGDGVNWAEATGLITVAVADWLFLVAGLANEIRILNLPSTSTVSIVYTPRYA